MSGLELKLDASDIVAKANMIAAAGAKAHAAIARALNHTGDKARTVMTRSLTAQTGLKRKVIVKALRVTRAATGGSKGAAATAYVIRSAGGDVSLKYFGARETRKGASAAPWNKRQVYSGTFIRGGRFPGRSGLVGNGHVFSRVGGTARLPIEKRKSGLFIPKEMITGATAAAFDGTVRASLPGRLTHELIRVLGG